MMMLMLMLMHPSEHCFVPRVTTEKLVQCVNGANARHSFAYIEDALSRTVCASCDIVQLLIKYWRELEYNGTIWQLLVGCSNTFPRTEVV
jgi:hypothetical protein